MNYEADIARHYGRRDLDETVLAALRRAGNDSERLSVRDLARLDHFHTRGEAATLDLAQLVEVDVGQHVLDVGGGLGGAARLLASQFGCHVTVLDLTEEYVRLGRQLTEWTGLTDRVHFHTGNALELPFDDGSFDVVLTQHVSMNVANKERLYTEIWRVLRPGGRLGLHEIVAGARAPVHVPVPWARRLDQSFLCSQDELRRLIRGIGFNEHVWTDETGRARLWFADRLASVSQMAPDACELGVHLLMGDDFEVLIGNVVQNLREGRAEVVLASFGH